MNDIYADGATISTDGHRICRHCGDAVPSMPIGDIRIWEAGYCSGNCQNAVIGARQLQALSCHMGAVNKR